MRANSDGFDAHLNNWVIIAAWLSHIAKVKDIFFIDFELFHEMRHTKDFVHAWRDGVNRSGATDFVVEFWRKLFAAFDDS